MVGCEVGDGKFCKKSNFVDLKKILAFSVFTPFIITKVRGFGAS